MFGTSRTAATVVALLAAGSLVLQFGSQWLDPTDPRGLGQVLWDNYRFFTIITNTLVMILAGRVALTGRWPGASLPGGTTIWILAVGIVYHLLLSATHNPVGAEAWANQGLHTLVPLGFLLLWLGHAPKAPLTYGQSAVWTLCPLAYVGYAMGRASIDGVYPYFFLNPDKLGWGGVLVYVLGLGAAFFLAGCGLVWAARVLHRRS
ncbi:MAG: Pr6Pr family membrane protein [Paracoccaceae bacterium]